MKTKKCVTLTKAQRAKSRRAAPKPGSSLKMSPERYAELRLSRRLSLAVADAVALEKLRDGRGRKLFELDMWNVCYREEGKCFVCLMGASMVRRLKKEDIDGLPDCAQSALWEVDNLRRGHVPDYLIGNSRRKKKAYEAANDLIAGDYNNNTGRAPWPVYRAAARILARAGL